MLNFHSHLLEKEAISLGCGPYSMIKDGINILHLASGLRYSYTIQRRGQSRVRLPETFYTQFVSTMAC
jgi:hypothetical protein